MAQSAEHGGAAQPALQLTFEEAQVAARATKAPPGRGKANEILKAHLQIQRLVFCWRSIVPSKCLLSFRVQDFILSVQEPVGNAGDRVSTLEELVRLD